MNPQLLPLYSLASQAEIERRARKHYELLGRPPDHDLDHWLRAEREFLDALELPDRPGMKPGDRGCGTQFVS